MRIVRALAYALLAVLATAAAHGQVVAPRHAILIEGVVLDVVTYTVNYDSAGAFDSSFQEKYIIVEDQADFQINFFFVGSIDGQNAVIDLPSGQSVPVSVGDVVCVVGQLERLRFGFINQEGQIPFVVDLREGMCSSFSFAKQGGELG